jgi:hypothetical protein
MFIHSLHPLWLAVWSDRSLSASGAKSYLRHLELGAGTVGDAMRKMSWLSGSP